MLEMGTLVGYYRDEVHEMHDTVRVKRKNQ